MTMENEEFVPDTQVGEDEILTKKDRKKLKKAEKKAARKLKRKEKSLYKAKLRREIKDRKRAVYRSRGFLGKIFYVLGRIINFLLIIALAITVIRVNYVEIGRMGMTLLYKFADSAVPEEVDQEKLDKVLGTDEEAAAMIDATAPIGEDETWAIYLYMVGSDLEARYNDQMSETALTLVELEAAGLTKEKQARNVSQLGEMVDTMYEQGLDLPNSFYAKNEYGKLTTQATNIFDQILVPTYNFHFASGDLSSIFEVELPENVKIVFQPGGAGAWNHDMINPNRCQRFLYDSEGITEVYNGHIRNMADPDTLADFLGFCKDEYPADNTMVVFWNHGGGPFGYGVDALYKRDILSIGEMRQAFDKVFEPNENDPPIDIIGFDACLMASMEAANEFNGFASYLVGSEDVEPGEGWDYTTWLGDLAENPRMNPLQLSKAVADSYVEFYASKAPKAGSAELFSVIDLKYADDLYDAYSDFTAAALEESTHNPGTAAVLGRSANSSIKYAGNDNSYNLVDLKLFMEAAEPFYEKEAAAVTKLVDKAVVYNRANNLARESGGITVYYPATVQSIGSLAMAIDYINNVCRSDDVRALYYYKVAGCLNEELQTYVSENYGELPPMDSTPIKDIVKQELSFMEDGNYSFAATEEALTLIQDFEMNLMQLDGEGNALYLGQDRYIKINEDNSVSTTFKCLWGFLEGQPLRLEQITTTDSFIRYSSDVLYNDKEAKLMIVYDRQQKEWGLVGVQLADDDDNSDAVIADRITESLEPGDRITPLYISYDMATGSSTRTEGKTITYRASSRVVDGVLPDGQYLSYVGITDARGEVYTMPVVSFDIKNGAMIDAEDMELSWIKAS